MISFYRVFFALLCYNFLMDTAILQFFQTIRCDFLTVFFGFFSFLGDGALFVAAVAAVYWFVDKRTGEQLVLTMLSSVSLNSALKTAVGRLRPYAAGDVSLLRVDTFLFSTADLADAASFPSGHAQSSSTFACAVSCRARRTWVWIVSVLFVLLVMCSRLYFGVHYPSDVLAGFALGVGCALLWELIYRKAYGARYFILAAVAIVFLLLIPFVPSHSLILAAGATAGCAVFLPLDHEFIHAQIPRSPRKFFRLLVGGILLGGLYALSRLLPADYDLLAYFVLTGAATAGCQALFRLFRI